MIGFASYAEKAAAAVPKAEEALNRHVGDRDAHAAAKPDGSDLEALITWKRLAADHDLRVEAAEEAVKFARGVAADQAAKAAEAEADRRHAAAQKIARAGEKLTLDVVAAAERLAEALAALEANRAQVEEANAVRGSRPYIVDGERKIREVPGQEVPAIVDRDFAWVDPAGNRAPLSLVASAGRPAPGADWNGYTYREVESVLQPARTDPPTMPDRFATAFRLFDLHGRALWPR